MLTPYMLCDSGFFPSSSWIEQYGGSGHQWSLHLGLTSAFGVRSLIALQMVLAAMIVIGYRAGLASLVGWVLLLSLNFRNPAILYGGDYLATKLLLLSAMIPCFYAQRPKGLQLALTALFILQVVALCAGAGIAKLRTEIWTEGTALSLSVGMHAFARPYASLLNIPGWVLWFATIITPWTQILASLLLLWTRTRPWALLILLGMNLGIFSLLLVGWFMFYSSALMLAFIPPSLWDRLGVSLPIRAEHVRSPTWELVLRMTALALSGAVSMLTFAENSLPGSRFPWPPYTHNAIRSLDLYQRWNVFTSLPVPPGNWTVAASRNSSGEWINILDSGSPVLWTTPPAPPAKFGESHRWRSAVSSAFASRYSSGTIPPSSLVGRALVDSWNRANPETPVSGVRLFRMKPSSNEKGYTVSGRNEWPPPPSPDSPNQ